MRSRTVRRPSFARRPRIVLPTPASVSSCRSRSAGRQRGADHAPPSGGGSTPANPAGRRVAVALTDNPFEYRTTRRTPHGGLVLLEVRPRLRREVPIEHRPLRRRDVEVGQLVPREEAQLL